MKKLFVALIISISIFMIFLDIAAAASTSTSTFVYDAGRNRIVYVPTAYEVTQVISYLGEEAGFMRQAEDLFIDKQGLLYVADTGNNRVIKLTKEGKVLKIFTGDGKKEFNQPEGVYVDNEGDIYVADTSNERIVHLSPDGAFVEEFGKPQSQLLGTDFSYYPSKIYINPTGYIYVLKGNQMMTLNSSNSFRGYVGATKVDFNIKHLLIRIFASREQRRKLDKAIPISYSNFVIDDSGMIYTILTSSLKDEEIRKINSIGKNIYKSDDYFGEYAQLADIAVDKNGIISVIEQDYGWISQFDQDGNSLVIFGGKGTLRGKFELPSSMAVDQDSNIYVLDKGRNNIQLFKPTKFIKNVHKAVNLYSNGSYNEAESSWQEVLKQDATYSLAHRGIGRALLKQGRFVEAMKEYKIADDQDDYSKAFNEYRFNLFRKYFGWVVLGAVSLCFALIYLTRQLKKTANNIYG